MKTDLQIRSTRYHIQWRDIGKTTLSQNLMSHENRKQEKEIQNCYCNYISFINRLICEQKQLHSLSLPDIKTWELGHLTSCSTFYKSNGFPTDANVRGLNVGESNANLSQFNDNTCCIAHYLWNWIHLTISQ